jgi:hypothetical protein
VALQLIDGRLLQRDAVAQGHGKELGGRGRILLGEVIRERIIEDLRGGQSSRIYRLVARNDGGGEDGSCDAGQSPRRATPPVWERHCGIVVWVARVKR